MGSPAVWILHVLWTFCVLCNIICVFGGIHNFSSSPQCITNEECNELQVCIDLKCQDPCPGICHSNASCHVRNHVPFCACKPGYTGDPFSGCLLAPPGNCSLAGNSFGHKIYRVERFIKVSWFAAFAHCLHHGGRLATINSKEENDLIKEEIRVSKIRNDEFWTSGTMLPESAWVWMSTGEPLPDYADWEPGEPNNYAGDEQCLEFYEKSNNGYMWNDKNCWEHAHPICEYCE